MEPLAGLFGTIAVVVSPILALYIMHACPCYIKRGVNLAVCINLVTALHIFYI